ncbi:unnamed protein product [Fusarium venenatum]|uniref:Uncharacterized protein n=1 Tax=Fusarium venenatum TaxID=56646 RepID=A0A2L2TEE9_9HYPO|nr:uncharacterized protein FVRRES_09431 [Fusarium venenatum]CEI69354.1 unnamed protein product [Fusarium venenatum]
MSVTTITRKEESLSILRYYLKISARATNTSPTISTNLAMLYWRYLDSTQHYAVRNILPQMGGCRNPVKTLGKLVTSPRITEVGLSGDETVGYRLRGEYSESEQRPDSLCIILERVTSYIPDWNEIHRSDIHLEAMGPERT